MNCIHCDAIKETDYPMCKTCAPLRHFTNRDDCRCESCRDENCFPAAVRARFPGLVLIATSDDPPELRRVEFSLDALKPECRLGAALAISNLLKSVAKAA